MYFGGLTILLVATKTISCAREAHLSNFIVSNFNIILEYKQTPLAKQVTVFIVMILDKVQGGQVYSQ